MDLMYIAHPSMVEDFRIMLATVKILFLPESTEGVGEGAVTAMEETVAVQEKNIEFAQAILKEENGQGKTDG